jgi:hypothetical protein
VEGADNQCRSKIIINQEGILKLGNVKSVDKPMAYQMALLSRVTAIDGRIIPYEDFLALDHEDLTFLGKQDFKTEPLPSPPTDS